MKIKRDMEFISFSDGVCDIYSVDEEGNKTYKYNNLAFSKRILGYKRVFAASSSQVKIDRVIRIPKVPGINNHDILKIKGVGEYDIEIIQEINESNPSSIDLTLRQLEMFEV